MLAMLLFFGAAASGGAAVAQDYPNRPVRIIVPVVAGSSPDARARQVAPRLAEALGQPVVIENHPGANGALGARVAARAAPDGYTLFCGNTGNALNDLFSSDTSSRLNRELLPVTDLTVGPLVMVVNPEVKANTLQEFIALARAHPHALNYASGGAGSFTQLLGERVKRVAGIDLVEVPYKSPGADLTDLLAGHVQVVYGGLATLGPLIKAGKLRALAVADSKRLSVMPELPTMAELGLPGTEAGVFNGIFVPAGTPPAVIQTLYRALSKALDTAEVRELYVSSGSEVGGSRPEAFAAFLRDESVKWAQVIKDANIRRE
jgi:tripartite-type tricarboxylate transporter receptor subunit TctC